MSNDEKQKGPVETEVEALRAMLEQRNRDSDAVALTTDGERSPHGSSGEEQEHAERENEGGDDIHPAAEKSE